MSFSTNDSSTIPMRHKRTISKRVINNGDPLVANKRARDAAKLTPASLAKAPNTTQVSKSAPFYKIYHDYLPFVAPQAEGRTTTAKLTNMEPPAAGKKATSAATKNTSKVCVLR
jgi:hypothetical protein